MRFLFKTAYTQDLGLFRDSVQRNAYVALLAGLIVLPKVVPDYLVDVTLVFIYGLCGLSLMTLAGYTGLVSLGHAAFLGIGAYAHVYFVHDWHLPWIVSVALAAAVTAAAGVVVGLAALRMTGVYLAVYKTLAFAYSAGLMGIAGALFAHKIGFLSPDIFSVLLSIQFLLMVVVGGLGSLHGAVFGAVFVAMVPVVIAQARDAVPVWLGQVFAVFGREAGRAVFSLVDRFVKQPGLEPGIFGLILVLFILFEPLGVYGRWRKITLFFSTFPLYKHATFKRQKSYMRSERLR